MLSQRATLKPSATRTRCSSSTWWGNCSARARRFIAGEDEFFPWHGGTGKFALRELSVHAGGDIAFATGLLDCGGTEGGRPVEYTLRLTLGLTRTPDGWRIVHEHSSEPMPFDEKVEG